MNVKTLSFNILILISFQSTLYAPLELTPQERSIQEMYDLNRQMQIEILKDIRIDILYEEAKIDSLAEEKQKIQKDLRQALSEKKQLKLICDLKETELEERQHLIWLEKHQKEFQERKQQFQLEEEPLNQRDLEKLRRLEQGVFIYEPQKDPFVYASRIGPFIKFLDSLVSLIIGTGRALDKKVGDTIYELGNWVPVVKNVEGKSYCKWKYAPRFKKYFLKKQQPSFFAKKSLFPEE